MQKRSREVSARVSELAQAGLWKIRREYVIHKPPCTSAVAT